MRTPLAGGLFVILACAPSMASADALRVATDEAGAWPVAIATMQGDLHSEGRSLHVRVYDAGEQLGCPEYSLVLDDVSARAFGLGACDDRTGATEVRLLHRLELFEPDEVAPRPRLAGISAIQVRTGGARGGARRTGASEVACSVAVRPYIEDLQNGRHVFLTPGRFVLRPVGAAVRAESSVDGWTLRGGTTGNVSVEYDVVDLRTNEVVVHTRATLTCGRDESNSAEAASGRWADASDVDASCAALPPLPTAGPTRGSTAGGSASPAYSLHVDREEHLHVQAAGDFVGEVDVYRRCSTARHREAVLRIVPGRSIDQSLTLTPGSYSIVVEDPDRRPHAGGYVLNVHLDALDPEPTLH